MRIFETLDTLEFDTPTACAIGFFDGVHIAHQLVLQSPLREAQVCQSSRNPIQRVVFTFSNHPQSVLTQTPTPLLTTNAERLASFEQMGFDAVVMVPFNDALRQLPPNEFVQSILLDKLNTTFVSVGYDHRFGLNREGDAAYLKTAGEQHGFRVDVINPVMIDNQIVSSTLIRKLLGFGDVALASKLLGHPYQMSGPVVPGEHRGTELGFPTANIAYPTERLVPAYGVYAGTAHFDGKACSAVANIGVVPTFGGVQKPRLEVHLLDNNNDIVLYDKILSFDFETRLRDEAKFENVEALKRQITSDCEMARLLLHAQYE